jgi:hypothetical protein
MAEPLRAAIGEMTTLEDGRHFEAIMTSSSPE